LQGTGGGPGPWVLAAQALQAGPTLYWRERHPQTAGPLTRFKTSI
jgi:hypothetical protein